MYISECVWGSAGEIGVTINNVYMKNNNISEINGRCKMISHYVNHPLICEGGFPEHVSYL